MILNITLFAVPVSENPKTNVSPNLLNLPKEVTIELYPANNDSWLRVHSLSQNPRVRTKLSLQKRLSSLVEYLSKRWNPWRVIDTECQTLCGTSLPNGQQTDGQCLRVRPHSSGDLNNVSLSKSLFNSQMDLSLTAYIKTLYNNELKGSSKKSKPQKSKDKESSSDQNGSEANAKSSEPNSEAVNDNSLANEDNGDKNYKNELLKNSDSKSDEDEPIAEAERSMTLLRMLAKMHEMSEDIQPSDDDDDKDDDDQTKEDDDQNKDDEEERDIPSPETSPNICLPVPPTNATLGQWLSGTDNDNIDNNDIEEDNEEKDLSAGDHVLSADRARKGWSLAECGSMTIGELYLLFRCPKKIHLEYVWESVVPSEPKTSAESEEVCVSPIDQNQKESSAQLEEKAQNKSAVPETDQPKPSKPCDLLHKLLLAANLSLQSIKRPTTSSTAQTQKKRRIKPTPAPLTVPIVPLVSNTPLVPISGSIQNQVVSAVGASSQLLSNVISNTIFNDNSNSNDGTTKPVNACNVSKVVDIRSDAIVSGQQTDIGTDRTVHDFIVPKTPAPKAVNKTKSRNICGDPALIQEALRQLKSNKYTRRQRRPTPKPVFGQNKPLLPRASPLPIVVSTASATVSTQQPIYVIPSHPSLHLNACNPSTVLTQSLTAIHPKNLIADKHSVSGGQTSVVINKIESNNLPVIQIKPMEPIPSVTVPVISSSLQSSLQTSLQTSQRNARLETRIGARLASDLECGLNSSTALLSSKPISSKLTESNARHNNNSSVDKTSNDVLNHDESNKGPNPNDNIDSNVSNVSNVSEDSTEKLLKNPHMSSILEISLPEPPFGDNSCDSSLTDYSLNHKRPFEKLSIPNKQTVLSTPLRNDPTLPTSMSVSQSSSLASPPIERPKRTLLELSEHQWNNGESSDISLGTLLNACESPIKTVSIRDSHSLTNDVSHEC